MAEIQHSQIRAKLTEGIVPFVDVADVNDKPPAREQKILSRSVAVIALMIAAGADVSTAAAAVVDGGKDNGIDLIYFEPTTKALFLIQSKWSEKHASSIESGDVLKYLQGVQDLVSMKKDRFNEKIKVRWPAIEDALKRLISVHLIIAYPGSGRIAEDVQAKIDDFVASQNDTSDLFFFSSITQTDLFSHFVRELAPPRIDLTIKLAHYGLLEAPLKAIYGQVSVDEVAIWYKQYGNNLFAGNIRHFLGMKSDVNSAISHSLSHSPDNFWYFNNGLTLLVESFTKQAVGGNDRSIGLFDCKGVTVVNGAQTVGAIGRTPNANSASAVVQARVIMVPDPNSMVGKDITRASNTQNRIDARNFVALDPEQERIRTELLVDGVGYEFREGESIESSTEGFEFIEGITVLACSSGEASYVALAKGHVGGLYADINSAPYKALFNSGTSSKRLWRLVQLVRLIDAPLRELQRSSNPVQRGIAVHGNRLTTHLVLRELDADSQFTESQVASAVERAVDRLDTIISNDYPDAYLAPLFKNVGKCSAIRARYDAEKGPASRPSSAPR